MGMPAANGKLAVVLLSGGLDSATVLALARAEGFVCHALSFDYGQRHGLELEAAGRVAAALGVALFGGSYLHERLGSSVYTIGLEGQSVGISKPLE